MKINWELVASHYTEIADGKSVTRYILKKANPDSYRGNTRLGDVFNFLPSGLVYKDETAMGATHLELYSERNSIIVEPIKITASSKVHHYNEKHPKGKKALYVGSETKLYPSKVTPEDIEAYINATKGNKKIVVVADSLGKVIKAIGKDNRKNYFLLIDEVDSFQMDASFRSSMEAVIETYKKFPKRKRAMVTATPLEFSDPELAKEPVTYISYDIPTLRNIELSYSENIEGAVIEKVQQLLTDYPSDKIMVAYNSVKGCFGIAEYISDMGIINKDNVSLLCSSTNKDEVLSYYAELTEKKLPSQLNFVTSAYFTGFDLHEDYHLISISSNESHIYCLSEKRLKQIAGRCRQTLLSETIIYNLLPPHKEPVIRTVEKLIASAEKALKSIDNVREIHGSDSILGGNYENIEKVLIKATVVDELPLLKNTDTTPAISYLNIDALIESNRVQNELYCDVEALPKVLRKEGHIITEKIIESNISVTKTDVSKSARLRQAEGAIKLIKDLPPGKEPGELLSRRTLSLIQKSFINAYNILYKYIDNAQLLEMMKNAIVKDMRSFGNLIAAAYFAIMHPDENYKRSVVHHFPINEVLDKEQILLKWKDVLKDIGSSKKIESAVRAMRLTKNHFKLAEHRPEGQDGKRKMQGHKIVSDNPKGFKIIQMRPLVNHQTEINYIFKALA